MGRGRGERRGKGRHDSGEENMFCLPVLQEEPYGEKGHYFHTKQRGEGVV